MFIRFPLARIGVCAAVLTALAWSAASAAFVRAPAAAAVHVDVIGHLHNIVTIGSTVDPMNGDQNPYGLTIAPSSNGAMKKGDLVICNFNDKANIQGLGTTLEVLHPAPGSSPVTLAKDPTLTGCTAIALSPGDNPWVAAYVANDNPILSPTGMLLTSLNNFSWNLPFGQAFSATPGVRGAFGAFYESNARDGSIVRINLAKKGLTFNTIVRGFPVNHGVPGKILGPSGLTYDMAHDILYIVDGTNNTVYAINAPGKVPPEGIFVRPDGFFGPAAAAARVVFSGAPLNAPISASQLFNGDLVVGNTGDNKLVELSAPFGKVIHVTNLDKGIAGALFGIVASGTSIADTKVYFNDDNDNTVKVLQAGP